jgi:hypothetical protein
MPAFSPATLFSPRAEKYLNIEIYILYVLFVIDSVLSYFRNICRCTSKCMIVVRVLYVRRYLRYVASYVRACTS